MPPYTLSSGEHVDVEDAAALDALAVLVASPYTSPDDILALLDEHLPREPQADNWRAPFVIAVMDAWLACKRAPVPQKPADAMSVAQVAERKGMTPDAIRKAIYSGRLRARQWAGAWRVDPLSVQEMDTPARGPAARVSAITGISSTATLDIKTDGEQLPLDVTPEGEWIKASACKVASWKWIKVLTSNRQGGARRLFVLAPGSEVNEVKIGPFVVRGRFEIERKVNNARKAGEEWRES